MMLGLFDGIHGWHAFEPQGDSVAIEWDKDACHTLSALGVPTIRADVAAYPAEVFAGRVEGITASPPCQSFSKAGKRGGLDDPRGQFVFEPLQSFPADYPVTGTKTAKFRQVGNAIPPLLAARILEAVR